MKISNLVIGILALSIICSPAFSKNPTEKNNQPQKTEKVEKTDKSDKQEKTEKADNKKTAKPCKKGKKVDTSKNKTAVKDSTNAPKADTVAVDSVAKPSAPAPKPLTPYEQFLKGIKKTVKGNFITIHQTEDDRIYFELPKKYNGRRFLAGGVISTVSNPAFVDIGFKYDTPKYLQIDIKDSLLTFLIPNDLATTQEEQMQTAIKRNYNPIIYKRYIITRFNNDSTSLIFSPESIINDLFPQNVNFNYSGKINFLNNIKAFDDNASLSYTKSVENNRPIMGMKVPLGEGTITTTVSFLLLPEKPMRPRIQDSRVGVFPTDPKLNLSTSEDGFTRYILATRWRLEPKDTLAWLEGRPTGVKKPIVWYIDNSFPEDWKTPIKKGVLAWNKAFEKFGLYNVMQVKEFPTKEEDPNFDPDNLKYNCLRYIPKSTQNAMGPSWVDPMTGEILNASVIVYNDVIKLVNNWRFVMTAQVDPRARTKKMPKDLMEQSMIYVISHEIGHTLGLMHNMGASHAIPVDSLRSPKFTAVYGTTPSIMDYARFNYVAQPGDKGVNLVPPALGVYDKYVIEWLYKPIIEAKDMWEESAIANKLIDEKAGNPYYMYGPQQMQNFGDNYDPRSRVEDLGNDPIKASNYGIKNLKYILPNLNDWIQDDPGRKYRETIYGEIIDQYFKYLENVLSQVGGIYLTRVKDGTPGVPVQVVDKKTQRASLKWTIKQICNSNWLDNNDITKRFSLHTPASSKLAYALADYLVNYVPNKLMLANTCTDKPEYTVKQYYDDLYSLVFHGGKLTNAEKTLQRKIAELLSINVNIQNKNSQTKGLNNLDEEEYKPKRECFCCYDHNTYFGEDTEPFQAPVKTTTVNELPGYRQIMLDKIKSFSGQKVFWGGRNKAHFKYIYELVK